MAPVACELGAFGNPTSETTTARDESATLRTTGMDYSASSGYFPNVVTDGFGRSVSTTFDARFGAPVSVVDANGRSTSSTLDSMGRVIRVLAPEATEAGALLKSAMPSITRYERCGVSGVVCQPSHAVIRVVSSQYGSPQTLTYLDSLGRTVRSATQLMEATYLVNGTLLNDSNATVVDFDYNARGQIEKQYEPSRGGRNELAYTQITFDTLSRPTVKLQRFNRVDGDAISNADHFRRTDYQHTGLTTTIKVCQRGGLAGAATQACSGAGNNHDGSPQLSMARTFDSSGKLISTTDANQKTTRYWFDGAGNPLKITDVLGQSIEATYNDFGYRKTVSDPDRGTWSFEYNGYGELKSQTDARLKTTSLSYDRLGRVISRTWNENSRSGSTAVAFVESTEYETSAGSSNYGTIKKVTRTGGTAGADYERWEREFSYDALARAKQSSTTMQAGLSPAITLVTQTKFDRNFGRTKQLVYPASSVDQGAVSIYQAYNALGALVKEGFAADYVPTNPEDSPAIRRLNGVDGRGLLSSESFGVRANGVVDWHSSNLYDSSGWLLAQCASAEGYLCSTDLPAGNINQAHSNQPLDQRYRFDVYGNLKTQWHNGQWLDAKGQAVAGTRGKEIYSYDALQRLTSATRTPSSGTPLPAVTYTYDDIGGLLSKSDYGSSYSYDPDKKHRLKQVNLVAAAAGGQSGRVSLYDYDENGNTKQRIENGIETTLHYDIANLPRRIVKNTTTADFYEAQGGRYLQRLSAGGVIRDTYSLEKTYEREVVSGGITVERYYLTSGSLLTIKSDGRKLNYLHTDRLGSPVTITEKVLPSDGKLGEASPSLVEHKGFDAFGKALDGQWGTSNLGMLNLTGGQAMNTGKRNQRGFTGHEHLDEFALIHMNGRAYDFNLGRFYGVDPFIQFPSNSQSLNPYGYLMNNPLAGTDPTGYIAFIPAAVVAAEYIGAAVALWGAAETGATIGTAAYEVGVGDKAAGEVVVNAATEIVVSRAMDAAGGKVLKVAEKLVPQSIKSAVAGVAEAAAAKLGVGKTGAPNGAQVDASKPQTQTQTDEIGSIDNRGDEIGPHAPGDVPNDYTVVKGGTKPVPENEEFSVSYGSDKVDAGAGVPHNQVQTTTAGDIRNAGGSIDVKPEPNADGTKMNYQHANVVIPPGKSEVFQQLEPNQSAKNERVGQPGHRASSDCKKEGACE